MVIAAASAVHAHDPGLSTAQGHLRAGVLELTTGFAPADAQYFLPSDARTLSQWEEPDFEGIVPLLEAVLPELWEADSDGVPLQLLGGRVQLLPGDNVSFQQEFRVAEGARLNLRSRKLSELSSNHRQFVMIFDEAGSLIARKLLNAKEDSLEISPAAAAASATSREQTDHASAVTAWEFIKLGIEHIWMGFDHLLFLFALLVVCRSFRSIVAIVTCFTVAHSLTLAAATLDWVNLPARIVETVIAASIVYVGAENLLRSGKEPRGRWVLTFAFGLVHGFGFATVLRDLGVGGGPGSVFLPLLTFNLGVEIGQVAIAAVVLPIIWQLRKRETFIRLGVPSLSALVVVAGLYWLVERAVLV